MSGSKRAQALANQYQYISKNPDRFFNCPYDTHSLVLKETNWGFKWECPICNAYVGCHKGTTQPLGTAARESLRKLRIETHEIFDKLWVNHPHDRARQRRRSYSRLASGMNLTKDECHIAMFTEEQCKKAIALCEYEYRTKLCPLKNML